jgi:uncharacterized protein
MTYLPNGLPEPVTESDKLDLPYWQGTRAGKLMIQRCGACQTWQWGPEWLCHKCHSFDMKWAEIAGPDPGRYEGKIYSWTRCWHPVHPALKTHGPYIAVVVEMPHAGRIRMLGNLLGPPEQKVEIGATVVAVFEPHDDAQVPYTLVQWKRV